MKDSAIGNIVLDVLKKNETTRSNDFALVYQVLREINIRYVEESRQQSVAMEIAKFGQYWLDIQKELGIYSFEGITRYRRKYQAQYEELKATPEAIESRKNQERKYRELSKQWKSKKN